MPSENRALWVHQARAALIIAATRRTLLTYGELGMALEMEGVNLRNQLGHVLDDVSEDCRARGEDCSLAGGSPQPRKRKLNVAGEFGDEGGASSKRR